MDKQMTGKVISAARPVAHQSAASDRMAECHLADAALRSNKHINRVLATLLFLQAGLAECSYSAGLPCHLSRDCAGLVAGAALVSYDAAAA
jgi:hypothetical protein